MTTITRFERADAPASLRPRAESRVWRVTAGLAISLLGLVAAALAAEVGLRWRGYRMPVLLDDSVRNEYRIEPNAAFTYYGYLPAGG
jgi:hypothetical protein